MTLRHLRIFCAVCERGSMSAAAQSLFMAQPSVSQAVRELEEHYGTLLFERLGRRLALTPAGERLYPKARAMVDQFDELERENAQERQPQVLRIGANLTVGCALLHFYLNRLETEYPQAELRVYVSRSSDLLAQLEDNRLDVALTEALPGQPNYIQIPFARDRILAAAHPEYPIFRHTPATAETLSRTRLLLRERGSGVREQFQRLMEQAGCPCEPYWESVSSTVLIRAAREGEGVTVLPYQLAREALETHQDSFREVPVQGMDFSRELVLLYHRDKYVSHLMGRLIELVTERKP
ncbi:MAG: LysR family transcriptional regulator [Clostridiales bacterium]|nr:LysR family transcriptional regulator [Clostridiales bacterium]